MARYIEKDRAKADRLLIEMKEHFKKATTTMTTDDQNMISIDNLRREEQELYFRYGFTAQQLADDQTSFEAFQRVLSLGSHNPAKNAIERMARTICNDIKPTNVPSTLERLSLLRTLLPEQEGTIFIRFDVFLPLSLLFPLDDDAVVFVDRVEDHFS